jgi:hypothetical protein
MMGCMWRSRASGRIAVVVLLAASCTQAPTEDLRSATPTFHLAVPDGVRFEAPNRPAGIAPDAAIAAAGGKRPTGLAYVLMSNPNVGPGLHPSIGNHGLVRRPVYVLQFDGVELVSYGGPVGKRPEGVPTGTAQTYVDAFTGQVLYTMTFGAPLLGPAP